jgi:hypothetical protein
MKSARGVTPRTPPRSTRRHGRWGEVSVDRRRRRIGMAEPEAAGSMPAGFMEGCPSPFSAGVGTDQTRARANTTAGYWRPSGLIYKLSISVEHSFRTRREVAPPTLPASGGLGRGLEPAPTPGPYYAGWVTRMRAPTRRTHNHKRIHMIRRARPGDDERPAPTTQRTERSCPVESGSRIRPGYGDTTPLGFVGQPRPV